MPLGILSEDEFLKELESYSNKNGSTSNGDSARIEELKIGRGPKEETPEIIRKVIAEEGLLGAKNEELARMFNVSPSSVSAYKNGATSTVTYNEGDKELRKHTNIVRERIIGRASSKLKKALNNITDDKLADAKARDLAGIAKDMSAVIRNMEPEIKPEVNVNSQFVFFSPKVKTEIEYPIIDVLD